MYVLNIRFQQTRSGIYKSFTKKWLIDKQNIYS